jgi:hypothetical protein
MRPCELVQNSALWEISPDRYRYALIAIKSRIVGHLEVKRVFDVLQTRDHFRFVIGEPDAQSLGLRIFDGQLVQQGRRRG